MILKEAKDKYIEMFGGFPEFLFMGADEDYVVEKIEEALKTGKEIEPEFDDVDY